MIGYFHGKETTQLVVAKIQLVVAKMIRFSFSAIVQVVSLARFLSDLRALDLDGIAAEIAGDFQLTNILAQIRTTQIKKLVQAIILRTPRMQFWLTEFVVMQYKAFLIERFTSCKQTGHYFAPLARFVAQCRSAKPFGDCIFVWWGMYSKGFNGLTTQLSLA